jgi:ribosomal protein S6
MVYSESMKKKVTEDLTTSDVEPRIYEVSYWLVPTISESELSEHHMRLQKRITDAKGSIISEEAPYMRETAYELVKVINNVNKRFNEGYFGWMKFETLPTEAVMVQDAFEADNTIIRSLMVKTVRDNTTYTKRPEPRAAFEETADLVADAAPSTTSVTETAVDAVGASVEAVQKVEEETA